MTPKEKAKELVDKYINPFNRNGCIPPTEIIYYSTAKQCALIAVDLRLECDFIFVSIEYGEESLEYWQEVKQEINNL